jgi:hypothetical protein
MQDYELIEPFQQLARDVFVSGDDDTTLTLESVQPERLAGIARRGWSAGEIEDGGLIHYLSRTVRGSTCTMALEPGLLVGSWSSSEPQTLRCSLSKGARSSRAEAILYSEVRRDLSALR